jgi:hypothetical protein
LLAAGAARLARRAMHGSTQRVRSLQTY